MYHKRDRLTYDKGYEQVAKRIANIRFDPNQAKGDFMRKKCITGVGCVLFILCGLLIFCSLSNVLRRKTAGETDQIHSFYSVEKNSLDVLFIGSSHLYYGVQPNVLWKEQGITSYVMGSPEQTAATSYFLLKEAFRYQKPKVVAMESYYLWNKKLYNSEERLRQAFDGMRLDGVKVEMLKTMLPDTEWKELFTYLVPFVKYHSRWQELENKDFHSNNFQKGARIDYTVTELDNPGIPENAASVPENSLFYIKKIEELCKENGAEFMMFAVPFGIETDQERYDRRQGLNLTLEKELQEDGVPFLFYQRDNPEVIDFETDFRDKTHLNTYGAEKLTVHLGAYLAETYELEDHRTDTAYASWNEDLEEYETEAAKLRENPVDTAD